MLAVLTCIDPRLDPLAILDLEVGEAAVIRVPAARVTPEALAALTLARWQLGAERVVVIAHTDCRASGLAEDEMREAIRAAGGPDTAGLPFHATVDQEACLRADLELLRSSPYLDGAEIEGFVYDVQTSRLSPAGR